MPKGYWIAQNDVKDLETYKKYLAGTATVFEKFGAKFLARGGRHQAMQGNIRSRHVVIEFESFEKAIACFESPEYQEAAKYRLAAADGDIVIVEGAA
ncbi:MAG: hypothetical protein JWN93_1646 [Hyphomicrobiales bacterium]|nr:hypothetical protein [Hyphomicrobiales bacterium]